jgi:hypothetical protein
LNKRNPGKVCKPMEEIDEVINGLTVSIALLNFIFNADTFEDYPIKPKILVETFAL